MKIVVDVIGVRELDRYIDANEVPFAVCPPKGGVTSERQAKFLKKYYVEVTDKRGWRCFYCNIINAHKCREVGYQSIKFADGRAEEIDGYSFNKDPLINKYIVTTHFKSGEKINAVDLAKFTRLKVEEIINEVYGINTTR